jgi:hypothetical protein
VIRGYAAPASGGSAQWVIGARQFGGYTDDMAAWGLNFDQALDRGQTISRLEDVWGRVTHQYDYLDVPGYRRKNQHQVRAYAYNAEGQVIGRRDFWAVGAAGPDGRAWQQTDMLMPNRRLVISNGQSWAEVTEGAPARNELPEVEALQSLTGRGYAAGGGSVAAQANETLQSVSQRVYGDARYWYVLAEANGIGRPDEPLAGGTLLRVPALQVGFNAAGTARPYSADAALGSAMPALPYIAPSPQNCGVVGQLLMVAVAVIATVYTAGMAGMAMGVVPTGSGLAATMSTGVAVLGGSAGGISAAAMLGAATLGGAAGSIASQAVGLATGHVQNFSWRGVATGALTAGVGAGVGAAAQAFGWTRTATAVASGLGSSLAQAGVNGGFSWRQVAANVIGNAAGSAVGNAVGGRLGGALGIDLATPIGQFQQQLLSGFVGGMVSQATSSQLGSGRARVDLASAAGDALGQALVGRWSGRHRAQADQAAVGAVPEWQRDDAARRAAMIEAEARARGLMPDTRLVGDDAGGAVTRTVYTDLRGRRRADHEQAAAHQLARDPRYRGVTSTFAVDDRAWAYGNPTALPPIVQAQVSSHTAVRSAAIEARLQSDQAYWNSHRGSLLGNALSFFGRTANRAGYSFIQAANSLYGLATDRQYGRDVQRQLGTVIMNPGLVVDGVSTAAAAWWRSPVEQKLEGAATTAFEVLASGGSLIIGRGIRGGLASGAGRVANSGNAADLARGFQTKFPYVNQDPMRPIALRDGKVLAQVVFEPGVGPSGSYFTTPSAIRRATRPDGSIDANVLNQGLQIDASRYPSFRPTVQYFSVGEGIPYGEAAFGRTIANTHLNPSGHPALPQVFIKKEFLGRMVPVDRFGNAGVIGYTMVNTKPPAYLFELLPPAR